MSNHLQNALISAASGAAFGALASLIVNYFVSRLRLGMLHCKLQLKGEPLVGCRVTARVLNGYIYPLNSVIAYITVEHQMDDVMVPPGNCDAFIKPTHLRKLDEDRLCWSRAGNPDVIDIYAKERQSLDVFEIDPQGRWIQIPSEKGWGTTGGTARVFLKAKKYTAAIKIVSKDTKAKMFQVEIDPGSGSTPLRLVD
jgi:hypothetical protein